MSHRRTGERVLCDSCHFIGDMKAGCARHPPISLMKNMRGNTKTSKELQRRHPSRAQIGCYLPKRAEFDGGRGIRHKRLNLFEGNTLETRFGAQAGTCRAIDSKHDGRVSDKKGEEIGRKVARAGVGHPRNNKAPAFLRGLCFVWCGTRRTVLVGDASFFSQIWNSVENLTYLKR